MFFTLFFKRSFVLGKIMIFQRNSMKTQIGSVCLFLFFFLVAYANFCHAFPCRDIFEQQSVKIKRTTLIFVRHGESQWNLENRFTGLSDVNLTSKGKREAFETGSFLKSQGFTFDQAFVSGLKRARETLRIILDEMGLGEIPVTQHRRLNERHLGELEGKKIQDAIEIYGEKQVIGWRRNFFAVPPEIKNSRENRPVYENMEWIPGPESFKDLRDRVIPFWYSDILPEIRKQHSVIVSAHLNTLRILIQHLEGVFDTNVPFINIPTGTPVIYSVNFKGTVILSIERKR